MSSAPAPAVAPSLSTEKVTGLASRPESDARTPTAPADSRAGSVSVRVSTQPVGSGFDAAHARTWIVAGALPRTWARSSIGSPARG